MRDECIRAVTQAAGRVLTQQEIKGIEDRVKKSQRQLAVEDRASYLSMSPDQRLTEAARRSAEELISEAAKKRQRIGLTIQKHDVIDNYMKAQDKRYGHNGLESLDRILDFKSDQKSHFQSVSTRAESIRDDYMRRLVQVFETVDPKIFGLFSDVNGMKALTYEMFGQDSSTLKTKSGKPFSSDIVQAAKKAAKSWNDVTEEMRKSYNASGGEIGKLTNWRMPQNHSQGRVSIAGREDWLKTLSPTERAKAKLRGTDPPSDYARDRWVKDILPALDRTQYVKEDGSYMSDPEMLDMLNEVWLTIATGGANKVEPGAYQGQGMLAKRNANERSLHFKDADSYMKYHAEYGGTDAYTTMIQHVAGLSHDMAMLDTFGPNPDTQFKYWLDKSSSEAKVKTPSKSGKVEDRTTQLQNLYDFLAGHTKPVASRQLATAFDTIRNWIIASKLGSAIISSLSDEGTMMLAARTNGLKYIDVMKNELLQLNPLDKSHLESARLAGLSLQTFLGQINRWGNDSLGASFSSKMSSLTIRASGLNALTEARRRAFGVTMYGSIGNAVKKASVFSKLDEFDRHILETKGISETDFNVWKKAALEDWGNGNTTMLTPESIYRIPDADLAQLGDPKTLRREAALKLLGMVKEETNMAVIEPGARERAAMKMGTEKGTWKGEIARSFFLLKSFPMAMINKHFGRGFGAPSMGGKAAYISGLVASTWLLGAASMQIQAFVSGQDPPDMTKPSFWAASLLKGGSLGIYGDFLLSANTSYGNTPLAILSGPVASAVEDFIGLTQGNIVELLQGKETHAGAEAVKFIKSNLPLQNLWYTKAVTDHMIFNQLQEMVSPGYNRRVESRARKEFGRTYYWPPGKTIPERGPAIEKAVGE